MALAPFSVKTGPDGTSVVIHGQPLDVPYKRVTIDSADGEIPKVYIEFLGDGDIQGEGIVHVVKGMDQREVVMEWLNSLDPSHMEHLALEEFDDPQMTTGQSFKAALRKIASGD